MKNITGHQGRIHIHIHSPIYKAVEKTKVQNEQALVIMLRTKMTPLYNFKVKKNRYSAQVLSEEDIKIQPIAKETVLYIQFLFWLSLQ